MFWTISSLRGQMGDNAEARCQAFRSSPKLDIDAFFIDEVTLAVQDARDKNAVILTIDFHVTKQKRKQLYLHNKH